MNEDGFRVGTFAGAAIIIQPAFLLLAAYVVGAAVLSGGVAAIGGALAFVGMLALAVLIHEFGHAGAAAGLGIPSKRIVLTFFGGHVEFEHPPEKRWQEIIVSAAGPLANLATSAVAFQAAPLVSDVFWNAQVLNFAWASALLGIFNLLPGAPLDGGHILRAALSYLMDRRRAAFIAAVAGVIIAIGIVAFGIWQQLIWTAFIGAFLGLTAWSQMQRLRGA